MGQYIGSRYVPKFMGTYNASQNYEVLCVVDNGLGTSYISKIPVPAGTPLTDTDYWAIYGASSGAIVNLQNQIDDMNDGSVTGSLQYQINSNDVDIADLTNMSHVIMLTDSFGENVTPNISTLVPAQMGWGADDYIMHVKGGAGFSPNVPYNYLTELQAEAANVITKWGTADAVKYVIVTGGTNDAYYGNTENEIYLGVLAFVNYVNSTYPNAKIFLFFTGWTDVYNGVAGLNCTTLKKSLGAWEWACRNGVAFIDCHNALHQHSLFNGDHIHPTTAAQNILANMITSKLKGGEYHVCRTLTVDMTPDSAFNITGTVRFNFVINDNVITANLAATGWFGYVDVTPATGGAFNAVKFGTLSDWMLAGDGSGSTRIRGVMVANDGGGAKAVNCEFILQGGDVYISIKDYHTTLVTNYNINGPSQAVETFDSFNN